MRILFNLIIVALSISILFSSCKKEEDKTIIVQGKIIDGNQKIPVVDAQVTFWVNRLQNGTYNPNMTALLTVNTDASGNYSFNIIKEKDAAYRITIAKPNYFGQTNDIEVADLPAGTHILDYSVLPVAYFKLHVTNAFPYGNSDVIGYSISNPQPDGINCCDNVASTGSGYFYENTIKCKTYGAQKIKVTWNVKKDNVTTMYDSLIYCVPFDTTTFDLNY